MRKADWLDRVLTGFVWLWAGFVVVMAVGDFAWIIISAGSIWDGIGAALEKWFNPFNVRHNVVELTVLSPALAACWWREKRRQRAKRPYLNNYYPLISRAVAVLKENTINERRRIYDLARSSQTRHLDQRRPPLTEDAYRVERFKLEEAIHKVELETEDQQTHQTKSATMLQPTAKRPPSAVFANKKSSSSKTLSFLSNAATSVLAIIGFSLLVCIPMLFVFGGAWIAPKVLDYMVWPVEIALLLRILVFLPLSFFRATRHVSATGFLISSFIFGADTWFAGLYASYIYFGTFWTVIALFFAGVGVVPLGIIGAVWHADWTAGWLLFGSLVLTFGTRVVGAWVGERK